MELAWLWPAGLTLLLAYGAYSDIRWRRLPNWLALAALVLGLVFAFSTGGLSALGWHGAHMAIALIVGMGLFAIGAFGGGDAKFYAGVAAYFSLGDAVQLLLWVSLAGLVTMIAWFALIRLPLLAERKREGDFAKFPYGVAIAIGAALLAWWPIVNPPPLPGLEFTA